MGGRGLKWILVFNPAFKTGEISKSHFGWGMVLIFDPVSKTDKISKSHIFGGRDSSFLILHSELVKSQSHGGGGGCVLTLFPTFMPSKVVLAKRQGTIISEDIMKSYKTTVKSPYRSPCSSSAFTSE